MIVTDKARVGTKEEANLLREVEDLNGRQRSREGSAERRYDAGDGRTGSDQAGHNQKDNSFRIDRFWEYLKANPTATPEEVAEEMDRLERTIPLTPEKAQMLREMEEEDMQ